MKTVFRLMLGVMLVAPIAVGMMSCRDRAAEKRIAELEARLLQLEGNKSPAVTPTAAPAATSVATPEEKPEGLLPVLEFEKIEHDFGTIKEGEKVIYTYKFKNAGQAPLIVQSVQPSCGCTAPDWSRKPVPVNNSGFVKVEFDSNGKAGIQNKTITVSSNTWPKQTVLRFKAMVTPKPDGASGPVQ